ncbi:hypothetical protein CRUP_036733 [Coryphaenoides rupestris]|nr:hypothetical protein CRUP_036733 [Coryphaenoides rupestris]
MKSGNCSHDARGTLCTPADPGISDDAGSEEEDDNMADPDFNPGLSDKGPSPKRKYARPAVEVLEEDDDQPAPQPKTTKKRKPAARLTTWKKVDMDNPALPEYQHSPPDLVETPLQYFRRYFSAQLIEHMTYQTNLYATQKDVNTTFITNEDKMMTFVAILIYTGTALH